MHHHRTLHLVNKSSHQDFPIAAFAGALDRQLAGVASLWQGARWGVSIDDGDYELTILDNADAAGALGYHDLSPDGKPYARVFVEDILKDGGSLTSGSVSVSCAASHEALEMYGDPLANLFAMAPDGKNWAYELCDPVEGDSYADELSGISMSNFVLPWFFNPTATRELDFRGSLSAPFSVAPNGYAIIEEAGKVNYVFGSHYDLNKINAKLASPASRTSRRGGQAVAVAVIENPEVLLGSGAPPTAALEAETGPPPEPLWTEGAPAT